MSRKSSVFEILKRLLSYPIKYVPVFRKRFWIWYYNFISQAINLDDFVYMNLGYADLNGVASLMRVEKPDQLRRLSDQLYQHVGGAVDLQGQEVLEIGCGLGCGSAYLMQQLRPKSLMAVDVSGMAIKRCQRVYSINGLSFRQADAESLPFADGSFDVVVSIESSNCFSSRSRFFAEVLRVLRPKGHFLYADILNPLFDRMRIDQLQGLLNHCGLRILKAENISDNVFKAREILSESTLYRDCIARWAGSKGNRSRFLSSVFCLKGTPSYERLRTGEMQYWRWVMQKSTEGTIYAKGG